MVAFPERACECAGPVVWNRSYVVIITRLVSGKSAGPTANRIHVWEDWAGVHWSGALMSAGVAVFCCGDDHVSRASAEADGIIWAHGHGISRLVVQTGEALSY